MNNENLLPKALNAVRNSTALKLIIIGAIIAVLQIPTLMIYMLNRERANTGREASEEVFAQWGREQTLAGPVLRIPYSAESAGQRYLVVMPDKLAVKGEIDPESRYRGIYQAALYTAKLSFSGSFNLRRDIRGEASGLQLDKAELLLGVTDTKGITGREVTVNGREAEVFPGAKLDGVMESGLAIPCPAADRSAPVSFDLKLELNGSRGIYFLPAGRETTVALSAPWPSPGFTGKFLPKREITEDGFTAEYSVGELNRSFPQSWNGGSFNPAEERFGVNFYIPVDIYQQTSRSIRYSALVIIFTMLAFFFAERLTRCRVHPVQYLMAGLAVVLFYVLLLSLGEHIPFAMAYGAAALVVSAALGYYSRLIFRRSKPAIVEFIAMLAAYGAVFVVLQLETYALLTGSAALFILLLVLMTLTGNLNRREAEK